MFRVKRIAHGDRRLPERKRVAGAKEGIQRTVIFVSLFGAAGIVDSPQQIPGQAGHPADFFRVKGFCIFQHHLVVGVPALLIPAEDMFHSSGGIIRRKLLCRRKIRRQICAVRETEKFSRRVNGVHVGQRALIKSMGLIHDDSLILFLIEKNSVVGQLPVIVYKVTPGAVRKLFDSGFQRIIDGVKEIFIPLSLHAPITESHR